MAQDASDQASTRKKRSNALPPPPPDILAQALGLSTITVEWLAGDGSDRCYYRLYSSDMPSPLVLMQLSGQDAQALKDDGYDWVTVAAMLSARGIFVPRVLALLPAHAALIIEDYGDEMLEGRVFALAEANDYGRVRTLYSDATSIISRFLAIPRDDRAVWCKRSFDEERFAWELNFFVQKYAGPVAGIEFTPAERLAFADDVRHLSAELAQRPNYFVHRDFHSRNLMIKDDKLAVIDFQDARLGPAAYDLVSLAFDSYVPFEAETRRQVLQDGLVTIRAELGQTVHDDIASSWRPMLLQRQLKAIGSFGYLTLDKQRGDYLKYVEPALRTLEEQDVADARWPFVSHVLIERLRAHLGRTQDGSED